MMTDNEGLMGKTVHVEIDGMDFYLHLVDDNNGELVQIMITYTRTDSDMKALVSGVYELANLCLLYKIPLVEIVNRLEYIRGETGGFTNNELVKNAASLLDFVAKYLKARYLGEGHGKSVEFEDISLSFEQGGEDRSAQGS